VKGHKVHFPDAKTAAMAKTLAAADPAHPVSLADAAKQAGLTPPVPGQDPGKQVSPADAKPGDVLVSGDKQYMLLGDGKFLDTSNYQVVGADQMPKDMGGRAGYFHLADDPSVQPGTQQPGAQQPGVDPVAAQGPVSGPTGGTQVQVPGATAAPQGPQPAAPAGAQAPTAPAAPSIPGNSGTPGVPKPGPAGAGPTGAASTNTGTGVGGPSTGGGALDPGAIK
jgi:hypothetical protein